MMAATTPLLAAPAPPAWGLLAGRGSQTQPVLLEMITTALMTISSSPQSVTHCVPVSFSSVIADPTGDMVVHEEANNSASARRLMVRPFRGKSRVVAIEHHRNTDCKVSGRPSDAKRDLTSILVVSNLA